MHSKSYTPFLCLLLLVIASAVGCKRSDKGAASAEAAPDTLALLSGFLTHVSLPQEVNPDITVDSLLLSSADSMLAVVITADADLIDSAALAQSVDSRMFIVGMMLDDDSLARVVTLAARVPLGLDMTVKGRDDGMICRFGISAAELRAARPEIPDLRRRDELKVYNRVRADNKECPFEIEDGVVITAMTVMDRYVTFRTEIDVEKLDFLVMKQNRDSVGHAVVEALKEQLRDSVQRKSLLDISDAKLGYRNRYIASDRKDSFDISFTPADLMRLIEVADSAGKATSKDTKRK